MNYHLNRDGQNLGVFSEEELRRRRAAGELNGTELAWCAGMTQWQPLNSVLLTAPPDPGAQKPESKKTSWAPAISLASTLAGIVILGLFSHEIVHPVHSVLNQLAGPGETITQTSAMDAASKPVEIDPHTLTEADAQKAGREFRTRQYLDGYQLRGERNPECDGLALGLLTNWIVCNYDGTMNTNLPSLAEVSDRLVADPACTDPLVLTVAAVNTAELHEAIRRLERAVKGFENSKHLGYPKFFATVTLATKLIYDQNDRLPVLDAQALEDLKAALADGSIRPEDQAELADILVMGWGRDFFDRNAVAVCSTVQDRGAACQWLALVLQGEHEISAAWQARGDGYVDSVSQSGWKGFNDHLATARKCLTQAWKLRPDLPLAPCRMIYVSLGDAGIGEMRRWFDRTVKAQIDYAQAWSNMRWGLRPRWYGDTSSMLAFGVTALNTRRFDTDVPHVYFDSVADVEQEWGTPSGRHIYGREDIWPYLQELYEGYIAEPSLSEYSRDGWRSTYAVVAYFAEKYDVARKQLEALDWQPHLWNLTGWTKDLSIMPQEVAARTSLASSSVTHAEDVLKIFGDTSNSLAIYDRISGRPGLDAQTLAFVHDRQYTLARSLSLQAGQWVDYLPTDTNFTGWSVGFGNFKLLPDGALEVSSGQHGHLLYSRVPVGAEFEVRGRFEVVSSSSKSFQAGLVMGVPQFETRNWYAFRVKRNSDEGDVASFSQHWTKRQILAHVDLDSQTNSFYFRFHGGRVSASVNGQEVFKDVAPPRNTYVTTNQFLLGLGAFNDSNATVIRYRNIQVRKFSSDD